jgi:hypothetical protein
VPHELKFGDIVQLGVDYQGGMEDICKSVKMRVEVRCDLQEDDEDTRRHRLFTLSETQVCSLTLSLPLFVQSNITLGGNIQPHSQSELSNDHDGTNTHSQESSQGSSSYPSSLKGYISKGIALCGKQQLWDAMEAFDLALSFSSRNSTTIEILLVKVLFHTFNSAFSY